MSYSIDTDRFLERWSRTSHFVLYLLAAIIFVLHFAAVFPPGSHLDRALEAIAIILGTLGYGLGSAWSPPRRPWTDEERAKRGLPPLPPAAPAPAPMPPPLPPATPDPPMTKGA